MKSLCSPSTLRATNAPLLRAPSSRLSTCTIVYASAPGNSPEPSKNQAKEEFIDFMESKSKKPAPKPARQIPIKGMTQPKPESQYAEWNEKSLVPEGWEQMDGAKKVTELMYGQRGFLFWLNKLAYASCFVLVGAWLVFRFVGPNLGLYKLSDI